MLVCCCLLLVLIALVAFVCLRGCALIVIDSACLGLVLLCLMGVALFDCVWLCLVVFDWRRLLIILFGYAWLFF